MGLFFNYICIILNCYLLMEMPSVAAREKRNLCPVSAGFFEFKKHFEAIKDVLHNKDVVTEISFLESRTLNNIDASEQCCFLLKLGQFYLSNVFPNAVDISRNMNRHFNHLANSFLGLKIELKHCQSTMRCPCGFHSHHVMESLQTEFYKLDTEVASMKALGELNILFAWMEKNFLN